MQAFSALVIAMCVGGCATASQNLDSTNSAELAFAKVVSPGGLPGSFDSLDGKRIEGRPLTIRVPPGEHVIEYSCPNVLSVDFQASTKASFVAGRQYLLECGANQPGVVRAQ